MRWIIDGNNVMGAGADGWWNDPVGAAAELARRVAQWCRSHDDDVILTFDGRSHDEVAVQAGGNLSIMFAPRAKRDAADDLIVELAEDLLADPEMAVDLTVVTSDKGLLGRLAPGVGSVSAGRFRRHHLDLAR